MKRIAVLGSGLLGGSIALAVQEYLPSVQVCLWGRREESVAEALTLGIGESTSDLAKAVTGADLIILASPVGAMAKILSAAIAVCDLSDVIITDVGSVKAEPLSALGDLAAEASSIYLGSHPMAGSEQAGVQAAQSDLFQQAACIITNDMNHTEEHVIKLSGFWESIGCKCHHTSAQEHDEMVARISHFPHLLASVGALVGLKHSDYSALAGNGLRDTTRVASGNASMWAEIMLSNRSAMKAPIEEAIKHLREMLALLEDSSEEELVSSLGEAKRLRDELI